MRAFALVLCGWLFAGQPALAADVPHTAPTPSWPQLRATITQAATARQLQPGSLIGRSDADAVLRALADAGWQPADAAAIRGRVLADGDFLLRELRSTQGKKFLKAVGGNSRALDRLDQMSRTPRGKHVVQELIEQRDGPKMLDYMTSPQANERLSNLLSAAPRGTDLNKPTGRYYTLAALTAALAESYVRDTSGR